MFELLRYRSIILRFLALSFHLCQLWWSKPGIYTWFSASDLPRCICVLCLGRSFWIAQHQKSWCRSHIRGRIEGRASQYAGLSFLCNWWDDSIRTGFCRFGLLSWWISSFLWTSVRSNSALVVLALGRGSSGLSAFWLFLCLFCSWFSLVSRSSALPPSLRWSVLYRPGLLGVSASVLNSPAEGQSSLIIILRHRCGVIGRDFQGCLAVGISCSICFLLAE